MGVVPPKSAHCTTNLRPADATAFDTVLAEKVLFHTAILTERWC